MLEQPTLSVTSPNDNREKIDFKQTVIDFQEKNDFNIPSGQRQSSDCGNSCRQRLYIVQCTLLFVKCHVPVIRLAALK